MMKELRLVGQYLWDADEKLSMKLWLFADKYVWYKAPCNTASRA